MNIRQLMAEEGSELKELCEACLDLERKKKIAKYKVQKVYAQGVGAGLLLQKALKDYEKGTDSSGDFCVFEQVKELAEELQREPVREVQYTYGAKGKPYFRDIPLFFSISHSGDYVLCVAGEEEIGADLQWGGEEAPEKIAMRFFDSMEKQEMEKLSGEEKKAFFYRLWTEKEAYGKYTGEGIGVSLKTNMTDLKTTDSGKNGGVVFEEYEKDLYYICICKSIV